MARFVEVLGASLALAVLVGPHVAAGGPGTRSGEFLTIYADARPSAMAGAYTAIAEGVSAIEFNPAGLAQASEGDASASYLGWFEATSFQHIGIANPIGSSAYAIGGSLTYFNGGDFERTSQFGLPTGEYLTAKDFSATFSAARKVGRIGYVGASYKYIDRRLYVYRARASALDVGILYHPFDFPLEIGMAVQNFGEKLTFISAKEGLPFTVRAGVSYPFLLNRLRISGDLIQIRDEQGKFALGAEWKPFEQMSVRGGYSREEGLSRRFTAGFGIRFDRIVVDYAYVPQKVLRDSHRLSLSLRFGGPSEPRVIPVPDRSFKDKPPVFEEKKEPERGWKVTGAEE